MIPEIKNAAEAGHGNAMLYAAGIACILANMIPTVGDSYYFYRQSIDKDKLEDGTITPAQYWYRDAFGYYFYTAAWYILVLGVVMAVKGDYTKKAKIGLAILSSGIVAGVIIRNINKDKYRYSSN